MNIRFNFPFRLLSFSLILCSVAVHAETGGPLRFSLEPGPDAEGDRLVKNDLAESSQGLRQATGYGPRSARGVLTVLGGMIGNFVGLAAGIYLANLDLGGERGGDPIVGALAGSVCGSTLGVYLAGSAGGRRGKFSSALLGSLLGEAAAIALAYAIPGEESPFLAGFLVLPPIGAALFFDRSLESMSIRPGSGFLNLEEGKLGVTVPDVQVRPLTVPGLKAKPGMQFSVRLLSVEL